MASMMASTQSVTDLRRPKIIVIDDDPTGSQTVHSCLLLMRWDVDTLRLGLRDEAPIFFILANTRAMTPEQADRTTREVCRNLKVALAAEAIADFLIVSRSDSTLRGHYPVETDAIADELGPFDAHFAIPAFFEGGRITRDGVHYLRVGDRDVPVHETEFAKDSVFGYRHSFLPAYVEEKTGGRIPADAVERFSLADLRSPEGLAPRLMALTENRCVAVDGEVQTDLDGFAQAAIAATAQGKRFLFRSAASILTSLAALPPQPTPPEAMARFARSDRPGAVLVGSHVRKTTEQLEALLELPQVAAIEVAVERLRQGDSAETLCQEILTTVRDRWSAGQTPVIYTSREELQFDSIESRLSFGVAVSALLMDILRGLPTDIAFLISKGGITSNDTLSQGLALRSARLLGQILPGVSVVRTDPDHDRYPHLPVVLFPGNVGDRQGLATATARLSGWPS
ncbi:MAG: four-carbon acid sugar kinase family protein [Cyanobacteria bacterium]|nr:four-carbon acid sugar kinase family protein [Cyanobacteriota bacterium]